MTAMDTKKNPPPQQDAQPLGFWHRAVAYVVDNALVTITIFPLMWWLYGDQPASPPADSAGDATAGASTADAFLYFYHDPLHFVLSVGLPAFIIIGLWIKVQTTPGKMAFRGIIVDAETGGHPTPRQFAIRYIGYLVSTLPFGLGFIWAAFHPRKQAWHDLLAGTLVVTKPTAPRPTKKRVL